MAKALKVSATSQRDRAVVIHAKDDDGVDHEIELSVFDVGILVSGLYTARDEALGQAPDKHTPPEKLLVVQDLMIGGNDEFTVLRLFVAERLFQDFAVPNDSNLAIVLNQLAEGIASMQGQTKKPWPNQGKH